MSPRRLSNRTDITAYPTGLLPVQSKDLVFDDPNTPGNEALSGTLGRGAVMHHPASLHRVFEEFRSGDRITGARRRGIAAIATG